MMQTLTHALYLISTALLVPVIVTLLVMTLWSLVLLGGFVREWFQRGRVRRHLAEARSKASDRAAVREALERAELGIPRRFRDAVRGEWEDKPVVTQALIDLENEITSSTATLSFFTRLGPMLGLMGTLIPLGPALTGLAGGNVQELANNLIVAFTTTVIGLLVGGLAYGMSLARRTWYARDMSDLEFLSERLSPGA